MRTYPFVNDGAIYYFGTGTCVPYSKETCKEVAKRQGLRLGGCGWSFEGSQNYASGCFAYNGGSYNGIAFYGIGGTLESMKQSVKSPRYRPLGYDCVPNSTPNPKGEVIRIGMLLWGYLFLLALEFASNPHFLNLLFKKSLN